MSRKCGIAFPCPRCLVLGDIKFEHVRVTRRIVELASVRREQTCSIYCFTATQLPSIYLFTIYSNCIEPTRLRWKFFFLSSVILLLALVEHILSMFNNVDGYDWNASNSTFRSFLETYTLRSHSFIFDTCEIVLL